MRAFPARKEILEASPDGAIALLDSVLGEGYSIQIQIDYGIRISDDGGWSIATEPPFFPARLKIWHPHNRAPNVSAELRMPGHFEIDGDRAWKDGISHIPYPRHARGFSTYQIYLTGHRRIIDMIWEMVQNVLKYGEPVSEPPVNHPDDLTDDEYNALGGYDIQTVAVAIQRLKVHQKKMETIINMARDRLEEMVAGSFEKEEK